MLFSEPQQQQKLDKRRNFTLNIVCKLHRRREVKYIYITDISCINFRNKQKIILLTILLINRSITSVSSAFYEHSN